MSLFLLDICVCTKDNPEQLRTTLSSITRIFHDLPGLAVTVRDASRRSVNANKSIFSHFRDQHALITFSYLFDSGDCNQYSALNNHVFRSSAKYLWFLHAGDQVSEGITSPKTLFKVFTENDYDLIIAGYELSNTTGTSSRLVSVPIALKPFAAECDVELYKKLFCVGQPLCHQSMIIKQIYHQNFPYLVLDNFISADSLSILMMLARTNLICFLSFPLSRFDANGVSSKNPIISYLQMAIPICLSMRNLESRLETSIVIVKRLFILSLKSLISNVSNFCCHT